MCYGIRESGHFYGEPIRLFSEIKTRSEQSKYIAAFFSAIKLILVFDNLRNSPFCLTFIPPYSFRLLDRFQHILIEAIIT